MEIVRKRGSSQRGAVAVNVFYVDILSVKFLVKHTGYTAVASFVTMCALEAGPQ